MANGYQARMLSCFAFKCVVITWRRTKTTCAGNSTQTLWKLHGYETAQLNTEYISIVGYWRDTNMPFKSLCGCTGDFEEDGLGGLVVIGVAEAAEWVEPNEAFLR